MKKHLISNYSDTIAVIIPFHIVNEDFQKCLQSILNARSFLDEIIIVNDGKESVMPLIEGISTIKELGTGGGKGPAHARNIGAYYAQSDILCFIDSDITVPVSLFEQVLATFNENKKVDALFGSYDDAPGDAGFLSQYRNLLHHYVHQNSDENASTFWTGCGAIRRNVFIDISGFNDQMYDSPEIEDIELGYRLKNAGHQVQLVKSLQVKHLKVWTAITLIKTDLLNRAIPWTKLMLKQENVPNDLNLKIKDKLSVVFSFCSMIFLVVSFWKAFFIILALLSSFLLYFLNFPLYYFFYQKRGFYFSLKVLPWHWLFYFLSGVGYCIGTISHYSMLILNRKDLFTSKR